MTRQVFITGGSGFVGASVVEELLRRGYSVNALIRSSSEFKPAVASDNLRLIRGDVFDAKSLDLGLRDCSACIHLVGIIMENPRKGVTFSRIHVEGTAAVVHAVRSAGIRRYVHMSALGTRPDARSEYHKTKWQAEQIVRDSPLDWTILRPSLIHGPAGEFTQMAAKWARKKAPPFLFMPYFGRGLLGLGGAGLLQPVYVGDVARAFVDALETPSTVGKTIDLAGPDRVTWPQLLQAFAHATLGKRRWTMAIPVWKAKLLTHLVPGVLLPFNRDQLIMSQEDNVADIDPFIREFGWKPSGFEESLRRYQSEL